MTLSPAAQAFNAEANGMKTLRAGFTTVRNLGDGDGATLALRDAIAAGKVQGPRIVDAGASISGSAGHMDGSLGYRDELRPFFTGAGNTCNGADDCRRAVRLQIGRGADVIKFASTGGVNSRIGAGLGKQMFDDEAQAIVDTAHMFGKKVAVHAHGADGIRLALAAGVDLGRAWHDPRRSDDRGVGQIESLLCPDAVDGERLQGADRRECQCL